MKICSTPRYFWKKCPVINPSLLYIATVFWPFQIDETRGRSCTGQVLSTRSPLHNFEIRMHLFELSLNSMLWWRVHYLYQQGMTIGTLRLTYRPIVNMTTELLKCWSIRMSGDEKPLMDMRLSTFLNSILSQYVDQTQRGMMLYCVHTMDLYSVCIYWMVTCQAYRISLFKAFGGVCNCAYYSEPVAPGSPPKLLKYLPSSCCFPFGSFY